jgi:phosphoribosylformimino-5-aminoimidazole carboxamide ribotide isomerase
MLIIPAIDLKAGKCVRLQQGRADAVTEYSDDPVAMAQRWQSEGAQFLHIVDLDAAFGQGAHNEEAGKQIVASVKIPCEWGGGVRDREKVEHLLQFGVRRVILGTKAAQSLEFVEDVVERFWDKIVVGIDAKAGMVAVKGWTETTSLRAVDFARQVVDVGVSTIIHTDIATDGMLTGPNLEAIAALADAVPECQIVASGGVSSAKDVASLKQLGRKNVSAAIVGKALYDGRVTLKELLAAAA